MVDILAHFAPSGVSTFFREGQDAYCAILASWLLTEEAHEPIASAGSPYDAANRHQSLRHLPVLKAREFLTLTARHALHADPDWYRLLLSAWRLVDRGYLAPPDDSGPGVVLRNATKATPSPDPIPKRIRVARESYDWVRENAVHLFTDGTNKYPVTAFRFLKDPKNKCPVDLIPKINHETWARYVRASAKWKPLPQ